MVVFLEGIALLRLVLTNKGTAFSYEERRELGLDGLLPPEVNTLEQQVERVYKGFTKAESPIHKYQYLRALQERHEILFYALLEQHLEEMLPIVYTPTVGVAVQKYSDLYQNPRGLSFSPWNIGHAEEVASNYPMEDVRMIVATDSSAILGIGDQGYGGLAIPIGKLALYTVAGGVSPFHTMPVALDVGTDNMDHIADPKYLGVRRPRMKGEEYFEFTDKFVDAIKARWPNAIIQWEDLAKDTAFSVLERYRETIPSFNDDIQGTGAVALAGFLTACRMKGERPIDQTIVIHGAGAGGAGVAWALREGLVREGLDATEAAERVLVLDSRGLLVEGRKMEGYKQSLAQPKTCIEDWAFEGDTPNLLETVVNSKATCLMGLSGQPGAFGEDVVRAAAKNTARPIIFPLSNPTASSEALPEDLFTWTDGKVMVATGSPFEPVLWDGQKHAIGQGNNAFIFPGLGFGAILCRASQITEGMVLEASYALADYTAAHEPAMGAIYPPVDQLREASIAVAARVIERAVADGVAQCPEEGHGRLEDYVRDKAWSADYLPFRRG